MYGRWNSRLNQVELKSYPGDRTVASLVKFGKRLSADVVSTVSTEADWQRFLSVDGSMLFMGFQVHIFDQSVFQHEDNAPPSDLVAKFHREASQFHKHHVFVSSNEPAILSKFARPAPFIARVDANQDEPFYYDGDLPFPSWVEKNRYPSYAAFEASNVKHIGWFRILVIGCYMPEKHPGFESTMQSLASYTTSPLSRAHQDHFAFGWLNSERYEHYLTKFFVYPEQAPTLFVWNMQDQVFYNYEGRPTDDVDAIAAFLTNVLAGKEPAIAQGNYFIKIYRYMVRESPWSLLWLVPMGLVGFFLVWGCAAMWFHDTAAEKRALDQSLHPAGRRTSPSKKAE
ncbi:hypothetical protein AaE_010722 [Aphanomyces astaci]|uniref:Thioredoxin domain-containing protein n=1 Tax=Aphanomyces astaci TaxID=112090 RepID=A0A6A4ZK20_APHAT|nr:hypothetical protein AaE_010722 [Aphanomyces astaci]